MKSNKCVCVIANYKCPFSYQEEDAVWVLQEGKAQIRLVEKGLENDSLVIIERGLSNGDNILSDPNLIGLKEGKRIDNK